MKICTHISDVKSSDKNPKNYYSEFEIVYKFTHVVEQLSFSMFLSILTFDFDLILR